MGAVSSNRPACITRVMHPAKSGLGRANARPLGERIREDASDAAAGAEAVEAAVQQLEEMGEWEDLGDSEEVDAARREAQEAAAAGGEWVVAGGEEDADREGPAAGRRPGDLGRYAAGGRGDIPPPLRTARSVLLHARALPRRVDERGRAAGRVRYVAYGEGPEAACGGAVCSVEEL